MRVAILVLLSALLGACATPRPVPVDPTSLLNDAAYAARPVPDEPDVLGVSLAMRNYLRGDIAMRLKEQGALLGLVAALESNRQLRLEYDAAITRTAAEAFEARAGNCLSLTVMTAALARELGIGVSFRRVHSETVWSRQSDTLYGSGHVNVVLEPSLHTGARNFDRVRGIVVDFLPGAELKGQRSQEIGEKTIVAMYMNNRAVEALGRGELDDAYWWARGAVRRDARFLEAFNTLGVIHSRRGDATLAERAFRYVLALEAENVSALANLAGLLERAGRVPEARVLEAKLRRLEGTPPFHEFDLGMAALKRRDFEAARNHFLRELDRNAFYHEAHFGLAVAYYALGDARSAREHLATAQETSTSRGDQDRYAAKLAWLRAQRPR